MDRVPTWLERPKLKLATDTMLRVGRGGRTRSAAHPS